MLCQNYIGAGAAVCEMVESVICDQRRVFPACAYLDGEYGYKDIYLGVPVIIGKNSIERVIELELDPDDREHFETSQRSKSHVGIDEEPYIVNGFRFIL